MSWSSPIPLSATDDTGTTWQILRAWPYTTPGDYTLEVSTPGSPGVRGARLRGGNFDLVPLDDPRLPALRPAAEQGVLVRYMPYKRAVVQAESRYIKVFRRGRAAVPAERCAQMDVLLEDGAFVAPRIRRSSEDVIEFSALPGATLHALGEDSSAAGDEAFTAAWKKWSRAWVAQVGGCRGAAREGVLSSLPLRSAQTQAADVWRRVDRWLRQYPDDTPGLPAARRALLARAEQVAANLLGTPPDPLVWAHGDLNDKQIIATPGASPLGLLDFDGTSRAEAALDLANLDAHLELHLRQGLLTPSRYQTAHTQVLAAAGELPVRPERLRAYSDALWLRLASSPLPGRWSLALGVLAERAGHVPQNVR